MADARFQDRWLQESYIYTVAENGKNVSFQYSINAGLSVSEPGVVQNPESKLGHVGD